MRGILKSNAGLFLALFHVLDPLAVAGGSVLMYHCFKDYGFGPYELVKALAVYGPLLILLIFPVFNMYRSWRGESLLNEIRMLFWAWCGVLFVFNTFILLLANQEQLRILWPYGLFRLRVFWVWAAACFLLMSVMRLGGRLGFRLLRKLGYNRRTAVIAGAGDMGIKLAAHLEEHPWTGVHVAGFFDDGMEKGAPVSWGRHQTKVLGNIRECIDYALTTKPDMVIIALPMRAEEKINRLIWELGTSGITVFMVPNLLIYGLQKTRLQQLGDIPIMAFNLFPAWKRLFDILFSISVLTVTCPLLVIIALLIKNEDSGPIFYRHKRIGESGRIFNCLKFRTMRVNADRKLKGMLAADPALKEEWEKNFKLKKDPRVTGIGRFLRKTSLDELPQFINVLRGDMSVVGARPIVSEELAGHYKETAISYCAMKPGITGPWQVGGRSDIKNYRERVDLDRWYVLNASVWFDLKIIVKTVCRIFSGKGAY